MLYHEQGDRKYERKIFRREGVRMKLMFEELIEEGYYDEQEPLLPAGASRKIGTNPEKKGILRGGGMSLPKVERAATAKKISPARKKKKARWKVFDSSLF